MFTDDDDDDGEWLEVLEARKRREEQDQEYLIVHFEDDDDEITDEWLEDPIAQAKEEAKDLFRQVWAKFGPHAIGLLEEVLSYDPPQENDDVFL